MPPFHLAFPVHDLDQARKFYGQVRSANMSLDATRIVANHTLTGSVYVTGYPYVCDTRCAHRFLAALKAGHQTGLLIAINATV